MYQKKCGIVMPNVGGTAEPFVFRPSLWMKGFFYTHSAMTNSKYHLYKGDTQHDHHYEAGHDP